MLYILMIEKEPLLHAILLIENEPLLHAIYTYDRERATPACYSSDIERATPACYTSDRERATPACYTSDRERALRHDIVQRARYTCCTMNHPCMLYSLTYKEPLLHIQRATPEPLLDDIIIFLIENITQRLPLYYMLQLLHIFRTS